MDDQYVDSTNTEAHSAKKRVLQKRGKRHRDCLYGNDMDNAVSSQIQADIADNFDETDVVMDKNTDDINETETTTEYEYESDEDEIMEDQIEVEFIMLAHGGAELHRDLNVLLYPGSSTTLSEYVLSILKLYVETKLNHKQVHC